MGRMPEKELDITLGVLKELNQEQRVILGLYFYENVSVQQIARILHMQECQVRATIEMVLWKIQQNLPVYGELDRVVSLMYG